MSEQDSSYVSPTVYGQILEIKARDEVYVDIVHHEGLHGHPHARQIKIEPGDIESGARHSETIPTNLTPDEIKELQRKYPHVSISSRQISPREQDVIKRREEFEYGIRQVGFQHSEPIDPAESERW